MIESLKAKLRKIPFVPRCLLLGLVGIPFLPLLLPAVLIVIIGALFEDLLFGEHND